MTAIQTLRAVVSNAKLGWNQEGNWTNPLVYLLYSLITPISGVLILVFMYKVIMGDSQDQSFLMFLIGGSSVFFFISRLINGAGMAIVEDREHYKMFRYIYIAPTPLIYQILGRLGVKFVIAFMSVVVTLVIAKYFLSISFNPSGIDFWMLFGSLLIGLLGILSYGAILTGVMLLIDRMGWIWAEGISGVLLLVSGSVVPVVMLPKFLQFISLSLPTTYMTDIWRLSLFGDLSLRALPSHSIGELWLMMLITALIWAVISVLCFAVCNYLARRWGRIERETFY